MKKKKAFKENQKKIVNHNGVLNIPNEINRILRS